MGLSGYKGKHRKAKHGLFSLRIKSKVLVAAVLALPVLISNVSSSMLKPVTTTKIKKIDLTKPIEPFHVPFAPAPVSIEINNPVNTTNNPDMDTETVVLPQQNVSIRSVVVNKPVTQSINVFKRTKPVQQIVPDIISAARKVVGTPYVYGGTTPGSGVDCSGFTQWAYKQLGISLPRTAAAQAGAGKTVSLSSLQPGDLLFYYSPISHVAMYAGNGQIIQASEPGTRVRFQPLYTSGFVTAKRFL